MKYRKKPVVIEAEIYKPGLEDGFSCGHLFGAGYCYGNGNVNTRELCKIRIERGEGKLPITCFADLITGDANGVPDALFKIYNEVEKGINADIRELCKNGKCIMSNPYIETLEGKMFISEGDYIITGVKGERYPCKPDIFEMTYEKLEE